MASDQTSLAQTYNTLGITIVSGRGSHVSDATGKKYLDFMQAHGALPFGHCDEEIIDAVIAQMHEVNITSGGMTTPALEEFCQAMSAATGKEKVFPMNSGTEAVETAIKVCNRKFKKESVVAAEPLCVSFDGAFHGRTCGALSLTNTDPSYNVGFPVIPTVKSRFPVPSLSEEVALVRD